LKNNNNTKIILFSTDKHTDSQTTHTSDMKIILALNTIGTQSINLYKTETMLEEEAQHSVMGGKFWHHLSLQRATHPHNSVT
jgi:hypothetical protein